MSLTLLIIVGSLGLVIYLLRLVTRLQDRIDHLERNFDVLSYNLGKVTPKPSAPAPEPQQQPVHNTATEAPQPAPAATRLVEIRANSRMQAATVALQRSTPPIEVPPVLQSTAAAPPPTASPRA